MKKNPDVFYNPLHGAGLLSLSWTKGPFGEGVEPEEGLGVGFFAHNGDILCVQFFDVETKEDKQTLSFENGASVTIHMKAGKIQSLKTVPAKKVA